MITVPSLTAVRRGTYPGWTSVMSGLYHKARIAQHVDSHNCVIVCQDNIQWHWDWLSEIPALSAVSGPTMRNPLPKLEIGKRYKIMYEDDSWDCWSDSKRRLIGTVGTVLDPDSPATGFYPDPDGYVFAFNPADLERLGLGRDTQWQFRARSCEPADYTVSSVPACTCNIRSGPCICGAFGQEMRSLGRIYDPAARMWCKPAGTR